MSPRPCERQCRECERWKHHSRFRQWRDSRCASPSVQFSTVCRECENRLRDALKNADRPVWLIRERARRLAHRLGVDLEFVWTQLNYRALVPYMRAMLTPEGLCISCGHPFLNERDVQIEHNAPPRHNQDWARWHARNTRLLCASSNLRKGKKPYEQWLDDEESARLSNNLDFALIRSVQIEIAFP